LVTVLVTAAVSVMVLVWAFHALSSFLFLLLLAWLLSIAMEPMVAWLIRSGVKRGAASAIVLFGMMLLSLGVGALFGQVFVGQAQQLKEAFPGAVSQAVQWVNQTFNTSFNIDQIYANLQLTPERVAQLAQQYGGGLLGVFGTALTVFAQLVTILVFAYYLSADSIRLRQTIGSWLPQRYQPVLLTIWTIAVEKTGGYVVSKLILALLSALFHCLFFWAIQIPFWLPLGVLAGVVGQFVPIIGTYIGVILPALFTLLDQPIKVVYIVIFATIFQQIESYWFTPKVSNKTMDIHPAVALAAVFVGVGLFGPVGALIGIPVMAAALAIIDSLRRQHQLMPELEALQDDDGEVPTQEDVVELVAEARASIEREEAHRAARSDQVVEVVKDVPTPDVASVATVASEVIDQPK
jgi:predicted PurR-regulated permease PerM